MILFYSKDVDDFVNQVIDCIDDEFIRFSEFDKIEIAKMEFCNESSTYEINNEYIENIDLEKVKSIWFNGGVINSLGDEYEDKCYEILNDAYLLQKKTYKLGTRIADFEFNRLDIMLEAKNQKLKIPHTLITSNKIQLQKFYNKYSNKNGIVSKRILDNFYYDDDKYLYNFNLTFPITSEIIDQVANEFALSIFQECIIADYEIRVIYIDGIINAACIYNFDNNIDYRTKLWDMKDIRIVPYKLPKEIEDKIKAIFNKFNMNFGSADLMYSNEEYYFLEINPTGQISFINNTCNFYLEKIMIEKLTENEKKTN